MRYHNCTKAIFLERPNRFVARVRINGLIETVHVKNTGRCAELLRPGCEVWLTEPGSPGRKTRYDLVCVRKDTGVLFNIDSQAANQVTAEWLSEQGFDRVISEYRFGDSRIDFYMEKGEKRYLLEIKGCTLERDGIGYFPDAPTERGVKHIHELIRAKREGYWCGVAFVIQMPKVKEVRPNVAMYPAFGEAWQAAVDMGVKIWFIGCAVTEDLLTVDESRVQIEK